MKATPPTMKVTPYDKNEWDVVVNGELVATLYRGYPERWSSSFSSAFARDKTKPCYWQLIPEGRPAIDLPDGLTAAQAKKQAIEHLQKTYFTGE